MPRAAAGAVSGQKPEPTLRPRAEGRKKKSGPAGCQDYDAVSKKNCLVSSGAGTNTIITPVCPSEPLCASIADGAESLPLPADTGRIWAAVPGHFGTEVSPSRPLFGGRKEKQDKGRGRRWPSGRSLRPAVRVVTGVSGVSKVGSKTAGGDHVCGHDPRTPTATTKKQGSHESPPLRETPFSDRTPHLKNYTS